MQQYILSSPTNLIDLMIATGMVSSKREARRLIQQGGVKLDGESVDSADTVVEPGQAEVLQVGRHFVQLLEPLEE